MKLKEKNPLASAKLEKIVVNVGLGEALTNKKVIAESADHLTKLTGQKPLETRARRAVSGFKLRAGARIGLKVTLRGKRMYDFLKKITSVALPRLRDFRGISSKSFDNKGNLSIGFPEYSVFPEMDNVQTGNFKGLEVTIVTTSGDNKKAKALLEELGMRFKKNG